jgi:DNA modification methylase
MSKDVKKHVVVPQTDEDKSGLPAPQKAVEPSLKLVTDPGSDDAMTSESSPSPGAGSLMAEPLPPMVDDPDFDLSFRRWFEIGPAEEGEEVEKREKALAARDQLHQAFLSQVEARLLAEGTVEPFKVYRHGENYISLEWRYDEYVIARKHKLPIRVIEVPFATREEARRGLLLNILRRFHLNEVQRCLLVLELKEAEFSTKARKNQGTRNDLNTNSSESFQPFNSTEAMAALANVSYQTMSRMKVLLTEFYRPEEESYLDKDIMRKYIQDLIEGEMSINQVYRKYRDARSIKEPADDASSRELANTPIAGEGSPSLGHPNGEQQPELNMGSEITIAPGVTFGREDSSFRGTILREGIRNQILPGENLAIMKEIPSEVIDLVFSSPDYNAPNVVYAGHTFLRRYEKYLEFLDERFVEIDRVLTKNGIFVLNIGSVRNHDDADREKEYDDPIFSDVIQHIRNLNVGLKFRTHYIWDKGYAFNKRKFISVPSDRRNFQTHEFLLVFSKGDWSLWSKNPNAVSDLSPCENEEIGTSVIRIVPQSQGKANHPCPFPEKLVRKIVLRYSLRNSLVADFWLGTGTVTAVASLGRDFFGCDLVPEYVQQARIRTEKARTKFQKGLQARLAERSTPPKGDGTSDAAA